MLQPWTSVPILVREITWMPRMGISVSILLQGSAWMLWPGNSVPILVRDMREIAWMPRLGISVPILLREIAWMLRLGIRLISPSCSLIQSVSHPSVVKQSRKNYRGRSGVGVASFPGLLAQFLRFSNLDAVFTEIRKLILPCYLT